MSEKKILERLYGNIKSPSGLSSPYQLWQKAKKYGITLNQCVLFLRSKPSYTLHRLQRIRFPRRKVIIPRPRHTACVDLADLSELSKYNKGIRYLFVFEDGFSRFCVIRPQKTKKATETTKSLTYCLKLKYFSGLKKVWTDAGGEMMNKLFQNTLKTHNITHYTTYNYDIKVSLVERLILTIKRKIYRYLTEKNTFKYIDVLQDIVKSYNSTNHRTLGTSPNEVHFKYNQYQIAELFEQMHSYKIPPHPSSLLITIGSSVRVVTLKRIDTFSKKSRRVASRELFKVVKVDVSESPALYTIEDQSGNEIKGRFYAHELVLTQ